MDRRDFSRLAAGGLLAAPMVLRQGGPVSANQADDNVDRLGRDVIGQLFYQRQRAARVLITGLILISVTQLWFANVSQGAPQFDEDRVATSRLFGGLTRLTIPERIAQAQLIGTVVLLQGNLIGLVAPDFALRAQRYQALVAHRYLSWEIARLARANAIRGLPALNDLRLLTTIGTLYLIGQTIMMILPPPTYR